MNNKTHGFSLLEILIAMLILSIGLLGFARAQVISLRHNETAYLQSVAEIQNNSLAEYIRACDNQDTPSCVTQQIANWKRENNLLLPLSKNTIDITNDHYTVTSTWQSVSTTNKSSLQISK